MGSLSELETQIIICKNLNYLTNTDHLQNFIVDLKKMTNGLIKYLKTRNKTE
jgi:four helix bundle protein